MPSSASGSSAAWARHPAASAASASAARPRRSRPRIAAAGRVGGGGARVEGEQGAVGCPQASRRPAAAEGRRAGCCCKWPPPQAAAAVARRAGPGGAPAIVLQRPRAAHAAPRPRAEPADCAGLARGAVEPVAGPQPPQAHLAAWEGCLAARVDCLRGGPAAQQWGGPGHPGPGPPPSCAGTYAADVELQGAPSWRELLLLPDGRHHPACCSPPGCVLQLQRRTACELHGSRPAGAAARTHWPHRWVSVTGRSGSRMGQK